MHSLGSEVGDLDGHAVHYMDNDYSSFFMHLLCSLEVKCVYDRPRRWSFSSKLQPRYFFPRSLRTFFSILILFIVAGSDGDLNMLLWALLRFSSGFPKKVPLMKSFFFIVVY